MEALYNYRCCSDAAQVEYVRNYAKLNFRSELQQQTSSLMAALPRWQSRALHRGYSAKELERLDKRQDRIIALLNLPLNSMQPGSAEFQEAEELLRVENVMQARVRHCCMADSSSIVACSLRMRPVLTMVRAHVGVQGAVEAAVGRVISLTRERSQAGNAGRSSKSIQRAVAAGRKAIRENLSILADLGGTAAAPASEVTPEQAIENILAGSLPWDDPDAAAPGIGILADKYRDAHAEVRPLC